MFYLPLPNRITLKFTSYFIVITIWSVSCFTYANDKTTDTAWKKINHGALIIDVRTAEEFNQGHLANAVNIPYQQISFELAKRKINKNTAIVLYCRSGNRSGIATDILVKEGYTNAYNGGGYEVLTSRIH